MSEYQIGKDVQDILVRLEKVERQQLTKAKTNINRPASKSGLLLPASDFDGIREMLISEEGVLAADWTAPFDSPKTWDSGSGGNLFVNGTAQTESETGVCRISIHSGNDADDSDKASRFLEAYYGFGYRNPNSTGKLKVVAEYYINSATIDDLIRDEDGFSAIDFLDFQRFNLEAYKKVGEEYVKFGSHASTLQECKWKYDEGYGDKRCTRKKNEEAVTVTLTSDNDLEKDQRANVFVGIWSGLTLWTDDYGFQTYNSCNVRLDKVTVSII